MLNPNAKGAEDPRAQSYLRLLRSVLPALALEGKHPEYILVENVAGFEVCIDFISWLIEIFVLKLLGGWLGIDDEAGSVGGVEEFGVSCGGGVVITFAVWDTEFEVEVLPPREEDEVVSFGRPSWWCG